MSIVKIRAAQENELNSMTPSLATAWENSFYVPVDNVPYQAVFLMLADPNNYEYGANHQELGYMQVSLKYPMQAGSEDAAERAELLRDTFKRGHSMTNSGVTVTVNKTPSISAGIIDGSRWVVHVKIFFYANITA